MAGTESADCIFLLTDRYLTGPIFCLVYDWNTKENDLLSFMENIY